MHIKCLSSVYQVKITLRQLNSPIQKILNNTDIIGLKLVLWDKKNSIFVHLKFSQNDKKGNFPRNNWEVNVADPSFKKFIHFS